MKLNRDFYTKDTLYVAENILGKILVCNSNNGITKGKIIEVEAYIGPYDKAAHSYQNLRTKRTEIMFSQGGYAYIYLIYGMYYCFNIVTNKKDKPEALLIRALEPIEGIELMMKRRNTKNLKNLCNGPGKLCMAMGINKSHYGIDLCGNILYLEDAKPISKENIVTSKRINIDYADEAKDYLWRYTIRKDK